VFLGTVSKREHSFALGIRGAIVRIIGNFLGSIIVGFFFDLTCKNWEINCSTSKRLCNIYDNKRMSLTFALIGFFSRFITTILMAITTFLIIKKEKTVNYS
jgi:hypothetical protein